jgi:Na+-driven multidrug efflux pump
MPGKDDAATTTLRTGWLLLAVSLPFGVTLEALHAFKVQTYLGSEMRRELWRLAHAHGTLLGIVCLVFSALAERHVPERARRSIARQIAWGAVLMPLGFFLGGILNSEGDPSPAVILVPVGAALLLVALVRCALSRP